MTTPDAAAQNKGTKVSIILFKEDQERLHELLEYLAGIGQNLQRRVSVALKTAIHGAKKRKEMVQLMKDMLADDRRLAKARKRAESEKPYKISVVLTDSDLAALVGHQEYLAAEERSFFARQNSRAVRLVLRAVELKPSLGPIADEIETSDRRRK